ncbi:MAG: transposase [Nitritalea sp.]
MRNNKGNRKSIRLKGYDYSQAGLYSVTICCQNKLCRFGQIKNHEMILNEMGEIAYQEWLALPERFVHVELDVFQIMPNHMHGIIQLTDDLQAEPIRAEGNRIPLGQIVGAYQSLVSNGCLPIYKSRNEFMGKLWQRDYYDHIIRDEKSYQRIADYIRNNPPNWGDDEFYR